MFDLQFAPVRQFRRSVTSAEVPSPNSHLIFFRCILGFSAVFGSSTPTESVASSSLTRTALGGAGLRIGVVAVPPTCRTSGRFDSFFGEIVALHQLADFVFPGVLELVFRAAGIRIRRARCEAERRSVQPFPGLLRRWRRLCTSIPISRSWRRRPSIPRRSSPAGWSVLRSRFARVRRPCEVR